MMLPHFSKLSNHGDRQYISCDFSYFSQKKGQIKISGLCSNRKYYRVDEKLPNFLLYVLEILIPDLVDDFFVELK